MNNHNKKSKKKRARCLYGIAVMCSILLCGAVFVNILFAGSATDLRPSILQTPSESKDIVYADVQQPEMVSIPKKSEWNLILANSWNRLPEDFSVELINLKNGHAVDKRIYSDLQNMMDAARAEGLSPLICSSYRTDKKQQTLFNEQVKQCLAKGCSKIEAEREAATRVAIPGVSEHQTGLAIDIVAKSYQMLNEKQATTAEQKWLMKNSYKYGFILRYPVDKSNITGIDYEPWHYRYVGKEAAKEIYTQNICLEEYLKNQV